MTETTGTVTECLGGKWFVCVNEYANGRKANPKQTMRTFDTAPEAMKFVGTFNLTETAKVTPLDPKAEPWYVECNRNGWTLD